MEQATKAVDYFEDDDLKYIIEIFLLFAGGVIAISFVSGMATCGCCILVFYLINKYLRSKPSHEVYQDDPVELKDIELEPQAKESNSAV